ncbi:SGNH/GDSL hydrolase family protein [Paraliobacillus ryukyuensis]|uniref:SGNH/GDSL hydrolase family protein n=1 Tax=Paraliobacillus ryukyuensis TaxID=200904 RepID=UPI0009A610F8|nr:SGNH/GDSL hydrolase family protein [Paraliobacillus ryukyuensis]
MSKKAVFILVISICFIGLFIYGNLHYNHKLNRISKRAQATNTERIEQADKANRDLYTKLTNGKAVRSVIVGDAIRASEEAEGWSQQLTDELESMYTSNVNTQYITKEGTGILDGLLTYQAEKSDTVADVVTIVLAQNDPDTWTVDQFEQIYETWLRQIIADHPHAEVITVLADSVTDQTDYVAGLEQIAQHYGIVLVNGQEILTTSDRTVASYTTEDGALDAAGNQLYAEAIVNKLEENMEESKVIDYTNIASVDEDNTYEDLHIVDEPEEMSGFQLVEDYYISSTEGDSIRYEFSGDFFALRLNNVGGVLEVYIDGAYFRQYDLNEVTEGEHYLSITNELDDAEHTVQLFVREEGKAIQIQSLIAG